MCPYFFAPRCTLTKPTSLRRICEAKPHKGRDTLNRQHGALSVAKADKGYARSRDVGSSPTEEPSVSVYKSFLIDHHFCISSGAFAYFKAVSQQKA